LTKQDKPIDFGYKTVWIAVKTSDKQQIAKILNIKNTRPSNWKSDINHAYENSIFITPQIGEWTLVVGMKLATEDRIEKLEKILNKLSAKFGEAQSDDYWEREDLDYANEELVMKITENWSINHTKLKERSDIINELGIIGE
jgi:hypothetical protein